MSLRDVVDARVKALPFEAIEDLLSEAETAIAELEKDIQDSLRQGAAVNSKVIFEAGDALKAKKLEVAALRKRRNELRRHHHHTGHISLERAFMTVAKRVLHPDVYGAILKEAKESVEDEKGGKTGP
jgi:hypothetical protein